MKKWILTGDPRSVDYGSTGARPARDALLSREVLARHAQRASESNFGKIGVSTKQGNPNIDPQNSRKSSYWDP